MTERFGEKERFVCDMVRRISAGELTANFRLPTESELAETCGIAKTNVHLGVKELERLGFLRVVPRHAMYVADLKQTLTLEGMDAIFRYTDHMPARGIAEAMLEMREMLVYGVLRWMVRRPNRRHMEELLRMCDELETTADSGDSEAVYSALAKLLRCFYLESGNEIFPLLVRSFHATVSTAARRIAQYADVREMTAVYRSMLRHVDAGDIYAAVSVWAAWSDRMSQELIATVFPGE
jgi:DNA-binding FadR family transcriptional regulator